MEKGMGRGRQGAEASHERNHPHGAPARRQTKGMPGHTSRTAGACHSMLWH